MRMSPRPHRDYCCFCRRSTNSFKLLTGETRLAGGCPLYLREHGSIPHGYGRIRCRRRQDEPALLTRADGFGTVCADQSQTAESRWKFRRLSPRDEARDGGRARATEKVRRSYTGGAGFLSYHMHTSAFLWLWRRQCSSCRLRKLNHPAGRPTTTYYCCVAQKRYAYTSHACMYVACSLYVCMYVCM